MGLAVKCSIQYSSRTVLLYSGVMQSGFLTDTLLHYGTQAPLQEEYESSKQHDPNKGVQSRIS